VRRFTGLAGSRLQITRDEYLTYDSKGSRSNLTLFYTDISTAVHKVAYNTQKHYMPAIQMFVCLVAAEQKLTILRWVAAC